jgi:hypothetical protein
VFVVGLPRSGTSLIEQMLGQHPLVAMAGEVPSLATLSPRIYVERDPATKRLTKATFDPSVTVKDMDDIASAFMRELAMHADLSLPHSGGGNGTTAGGTKKDPLFLVSKLPNHFELLGFIVKLFPGARVIHATRDMRDTLLSNYQMHYQEGHRWAYNLSEAAEYAAGYRAIMRHWVDDVFNAELGGASLPDGAQLNMMEVR